MSAARDRTRARARRPANIERCIVAIGAAAVLGALACGDPYKHTNPYDPAYPVQVTVVGPDSLFSYNEIGQFGAVSSPAFPDTAFGFASSDSASFPPVGSPPGTASFRNGGLIAPPLWPLTRTVAVSAGVGAIDTLAATAGSAVGRAPQVKLWRHSGFKQVVLTRRGSLASSCAAPTRTPATRSRRAACGPCGSTASTR